jgi:LacI family transcriptional regulator, galactose operon repressor
MTFTIEHVAALARVSRSTVSRVINNQPGVRRAVRERVLKVMREQHFTPHAAARSLAGSRTGTIGLVISRQASESLADVLNPFISSLIEVVCETTTQQDFGAMVVLLTTGREARFYDRMLRGHHFDGMIMLSTDVDDPILPVLIKDGGPLVLIGRHPYFQDVTYVDFENREWAREAVAHLVGLGHRRIAVVNGTLQTESGQARRDGYKQALLEAGIPISAELIVDGFYLDWAGYEATLRLLDLADPPTAIFAANDAMASGALRAIAQRRLRVPQDIAVVGFDDVPQAGRASPPLTTVHQPVEAIGAAAVKLVLERMNHPGQVAQVRVPGHLVVRDSSGATAAAP